VAVPPQPELTSFGRLSGEALRALFAARGELARLGGDALLPEHLLLALLRPQSGSAHQALLRLGASVEAIRADLESRVPRSQATSDPGDLPLSPAVLALLENAQAGQGQITSRELLASLVAAGSGLGAEALRAHGLTAEAIRGA
jgi:ATP-dependent Clp protease ATP-binding subunit ClpC